jgi:hypothetical protein
MDDPLTPTERRDELAADRDEAADRRDMSAEQRDEAARSRDDDAAGRDVEGSHDSLDRHRRLRNQILDHFTRLENTALDPDEWSDLNPAAFERLHALIAEQRRLAARDRVAIITVLDELDVELHGSRVSRLADSHDRRAADDDRRSSGRDRDDSAGDRDLSARDRGQGAIEHEKLDSAELNRLQNEAAGERDERVHPTVAETRRKIAESRARIDRFLGHPSKPASADPNPACTDDD